MNSNNIMKNLFLVSIFSIYRIPRLFHSIQIHGIKRILLSITLTISFLNFPLFGQVKVLDDGKTKITTVDTINGTTDVFIVVRKEDGVLEVAGIGEGLILNEDGTISINPNEVGIGDTWSLHGNDISSSDYLGTNNAQDLKFAVDGTVRLRIDPFGRLIQNVAGASTIALGENAGGENMTGNHNLLLGVRAGGKLTTGSQNICFGINAGRDLDDGNWNFLMGSQAGAEHISNKENIMMGFQAGLKGGNFSNIMGFQAGTYTTGNYNNYFGKHAAKGTSQNMLIGSYNNNFGHKSGEFAGGSNNNFLGYRSGQSLNSGSGNNFFGKDAGGGEYDVFNQDYFTSSGNNNNYIGVCSGQYTTGSYNNYIGYKAGTGTLTSTNSGEDNNFFGQQTGRLNTIGSKNNLFGYRAGERNASGESNNIFGNEAGRFANGSKNIYIGYRAGYGNSNALNTGNNNIFLGQSAGSAHETGNDNILIGKSTNISTANGSNAIAIGSGVITNENEVIIGNGSHTFIGGPRNWNDASDGRFKKEVKENVPGLDFITNLRPVTYIFDGQAYDVHKLQSISNSERSKILKNRKYDKSAKDRRTGFIAQEVEELCNQLNYEFNGVTPVDPNNPSSSYYLGYSTFVVPLVKAVQEQQSTIKNVQKDNQEHRNTIAALEQSKQEQAEVIQNLMKRIEALEEKMK